MSFNQAERNCPNCGAPIEIGKKKCPYCGTPYQSTLERDTMHQTIYFEAVHSPTIVLAAETVMDRDMIRHFGEEACSKMAMEQLTHKLAEGLADAIDIETWYDPCHMKQHINARVRVLKSDYRF